MNSSDERLLAIDDVTEQFLKEFGHLHRDQLNTRISSGTWSIAQNIEHLIKVNETYYPVIDSVRKGTYELPFFGRMPFMIRFFGRFILKAVDPDRRKKIKTFPLWEPSKSDIDGAILARFVSHQEQLKELLKKSEDLVQEKTVISSPANRNIVYYLGDAFDIIIAHERRHLEQAREVLSILNARVK